MHNCFEATIKTKLNILFIYIYFKRKNKIQMHIYVLISKLLLDIELLYVLTVFNHNYEQQTW